MSMKLLVAILGLAVVSATALGPVSPASAAVVNERSVSAGIAPNRIAVTPDGAQTWTLTTTSNELVGYTTGATLTHIASWTLPGTDYSSAAVVILADGTHALVTDTASNRVNLVDLTTGSVTNPATLDGPTPGQLALSPDGSQVAIGYGGGSPRFSLFNTADWSYVWMWNFFNHEFSGLAFSPDGVHVAAVANQAAQVFVADLGTLGLSATLATANFPIGAVYSADGASIFVNSFASSTVQKFDASTGDELLTASTGRTGFIALSPDGTQLWASQPVSARVGVYDTSDLSLIDAIPFAGNAGGIAFAQFGCQAWVAQQFGGADIVFDLDPCLPGPTPALPDTGLSTATGPVLSGLAVALLSAGVAIILVVRRRKQRILP